MRVPWKSSERQTTFKGKGGGGDVFVVVAFGWKEYGEERTC
jgi:hypothetical protein